MLEVNRLWNVREQRDSTQAGETLTVTMAHKGPMRGFYEFTAYKYDANKIADHQQTKHTTLLSSSKT
jgi:hypothetical protein